MGELRHILALMGDQAVTCIAFAALLAYGAILLSTNGSGIGRLAALLVFGSSAIWLLLAMTGIIHRNLASWSPAAVILLAIGMEGHAVSKGEDDRQRQAHGPSDTAFPPARDDAPAIPASPETAGGNPAVARGL